MPCLTVQPVQSIIYAELAQSDIQEIFVIVAHQATMILVMAVVFNAMHVRVTAKLALDQAALLALLAMSTIAVFVMHAMLAIMQQ